MAQDKAVSEKEQIVKKTIKDCVFTDLFSIPENLLQLYQTLHPEDTAVTVYDLKDVTINNVLVDDIYNDLGFRVGDRVIILVEAQSTWSVNIIVRSLLYLAATWQKYIDANGLDVYRSTRISLPKAELYVIYTGNRKTKPEQITLQEEFFKGQESAIDVKVKMLYGSDSEDVISQYVTFTKVYDEQRRIHGRTRKAIMETIRICKDRNILRKYLESREKEVVTMLMTLYDEEQIMKNHDATLIRETSERVTEQGIKGIVQLCKKFGQGYTEAIESVVGNYDLSEAAAREKVERYWDLV